MMQLQIVYENVDELVAYAQNVKNHDEQNISIIADSIKRFGFLDPIALDSNNVIVWGHGRVLAAKSLGMATVPTITLPSTITPTEIRALRIAHNKLAEKSGWDTDALRIELEDLQSLDFDLAATGFNSRELDSLLSDIEKDLATFNEDEVRSGSPKSLDIDDYEQQPDEDENGDGADIPISTPTSSGSPKKDELQYSQFAVVMSEENKNRLMQLLNKLRSDKMLDKIEDALMELVRAYEDRASG